MHTEIEFGSASQKSVAMMRTVACISVYFLVMVTLVTAQSSTGTCSASDQSTYVIQELSITCGFSLQTVNSSLNSNDVDAALDNVCTDQCGGELSEWLLNQCNDAPGAAGLYYWCLDTNGTAAFSRCRYAFPPHFDVSSLGSAAVCLAANETNPCPDGCNTALMGIAALGCCYQSLYNNTVYLQSALSAGFLTQDYFQALQGLGNPLLWAACQVIPPAMQCTIEGIEFPTASTNIVTTVSFAATISVHLCAMIFLLVMALYMLF